MSLLPVLYADGSVAGVIDTSSGEVYHLADAPAPVLADVVDRLDAVAREARAARAVLADELGRRMGTARRMDAGAFDVEQGRRNEWDPDATFAALNGLLAVGLMTSQEIDEAMPERTVRKPDGRRLNALLTRVVGDDPVAAQSLAQARSSTSYVKVHRTAVEATATEVSG